MPPDLHAGFRRSDADARHDGLFAFLERVDGLPHVQAIKRRMTDLLGPGAGQHLLEAGCGMGHELRRLAGRVAPTGSVLGIDMNQAMIEEARRRTADLGGAVRCQVGNVQQLELGDDAVDGVRAERVLMYVPDQQRAISELARVVRPGGRVVAFELDYGATLIDLPDQGMAQRVLDVLGGYRRSPLDGPCPGPDVSPGRTAGYRHRTAIYHAAARPASPARRPGPGRRRRGGHTRGSRLPALAGRRAGRRAWRVSLRHVHRHGRLRPQASYRPSPATTRSIQVISSAMISSRLVSFRISCRAPG